MTIQFTTNLTATPLPTLRSCLKTTAHQPTAIGLHPIQPAGVTRHSPTRCLTLDSHVVVRCVATDENTATRDEPYRDYPYALGLSVKAVLEEKRFEELVKISDKLRRLKAERQNQPSNTTGRIVVPPSHFERLVEISNKLRRLKAEQESRRANTAPAVIPDRRTYKRGD